MCDELLKFYQSLINSRRFGKKPTDRFLPLQFPRRDDQFIITGAARRKSRAWRALYQMVHAALERETAAPANDIGT